MGLNSRQNDGQKVGTYFDKAAVTFDTFYDHKRSLLMQWVDKQFRSDVFKRYELTFGAIEPLKDKTVLDIGCGSGPYVVEAVRRGAMRVVGLDMAPGMLELACQRAIAAAVDDRCEFVLGTFPQDVPQEIFDCAIIMGVMDYIADPVAFLSSLAKHVHRCAAASFPSRHWFRTPFRQFRYWLKKCPVYFYEPQQIEDLSKTAGFASTKIIKIPGAGMDYFVTFVK